MSSYKPTDNTSRADFIKALLKLFEHKKGDGSLADLISQCDVKDYPEYLKSALKTIFETVENRPREDAPETITSEEVPESVTLEGGDDLV